MKYALPRVGDADRSLPRFDKDGAQRSEKRHVRGDRGGYTGQTSFGGNFSTPLKWKEKSEKHDRKKKK